MTALRGQTPSNLDSLLPRIRARIGVEPLTDAFEDRRGFPWFGKQPVAAQDARTTWQALLDGPRQGKSVAYIHVPFCVGRCLFCGFYRNPTHDGFSDRYARSVIHEISIDSRRPMIAQGPIHALYLGGGTPSALDAADLFSVITAARAHLPLAADCEITVEGRVFDFALEKARACIEAGANRFSIGIQSLNTALRRSLGRRVDRETALVFLEDLVEIDEAAVVCDLIYGLPGQTLESWRMDVETIASCPIDGVDLYRLSLFPSSPLAKAIARGSLPEPPGLRTQAQMYGVGQALLAEAGWRRLSQAHWGRTTRERNLYNQLVKVQAASLAYGAGAGGLINGHRYRVTDDLLLYHDRVLAGDKPLDAVYLPADDLPIRRVLTAAVEQGRIVPADLVAVAGDGFEVVLEPVLAQWGDAGLLFQGPGATCLTTAGWFWQSTLEAHLHDLMVAYRDGNARAGPDVATVTSASSQDLGSNAR